MRERQLIIHENGLMRTTLTDIVKQKLGAAADITRESSFEHAGEMTKDADRNWSLIVVSETAPVDDRTRARMGKLSNMSPACCFVRDLRMAREVPVLGLGKPGSNHLKDLLQNFKQTAFAEAHDIPGIAERVDALNGDRTLDPVLELEWELGESTNNFWHVQVRGMNGWDVGPQAFTIDANKHQLLLGMSRALKNTPPNEWSDLFNGVSAQLYDLLFDSNQNAELVRVFFREVARVGYENLRVSFKLTPRWHQAPVEALRVGSGIRNYWMLNAPMVRRFTVAKDPGIRQPNPTPLYCEKQRRDQKVNCLIITADPQEGQIPQGDWAAYYPPLENIRRETDGIEAILKGVQGREVGEVLKLDLGEFGQDVETKLREVIAGKDWHIVHFAGHGLIGTHGRPGLALNPSLGKVMSFENLANAVRGAEFLFVSSCRSADPAFIGSAIEFSIPAIIGFRWPVDDIDAVEFAKAFYTALFTKGHTYKSMEQALLRARNKALDYNAAGNTWASPVLLTQTPARAAA